MTTETAIPTTATAKAPQALTDLLMQCTRAHAHARLRQLEAFAVECATQGQTFDEFMVSVARNLDRHRYQKSGENGELTYDSGALLNDLIVTGRKIDALYREAYGIHHPLTAAERVQEQQRERESQAYAAERERRAAGKPQVVGYSLDRLSTDERNVAKGASGILFRGGHRMGWFKHVQGNSPLLVAECQCCGRWASVNTSGSAMAGTAVEERCER